MNGPERPDDDIEPLPPDGELAALMSAWLPDQRWFRGAGPATITHLRRRVLPTGGPYRAELIIIADGAAHYFVPVSWRQRQQPTLTQALIGSTPTWFAYDALRDPAVADQFYATLAAATSWGPVRSRRVAPIPADQVGTVLDVEQSNTSITFGEAVIMKFYRQLSPGINPDAEINERLINCAHTVDPAGELRITLNGADTTVALATRYITNCADGWAAATASVRDLLAEGDLAADEVGGDFAPEAERLGIAVAAVHDALAAAFGTDAAPSGATLIDRVAARVLATCEAVGELDDLRASITDLFGQWRDQLKDVPVSLQRIHGDLHLGQTLRTVERWLVIDFEGEPSRPVDERRQFAPAVRDIAGMVRSFDYAAHYHLHLGQEDAQHSRRAAEWADRNQRAFLAGYHSVRPQRDELLGLLSAYELAKAVYEVGYEVAHRPAWRSIPLAAVRRLVTAAAA